MCLEHNDDVAIKCTNMVAGIEPETGTIRLVGPTGTPAPSGLGRLQFYNKGACAPKPIGKSSLSSLNHSVS